jgi:hypothetical protein
MRLAGLRPRARPRQYAATAARRPLRPGAVGSQVLTPMHALTYGRTSPLPCPAALERLR